MTRNILQMDVMYVVMGEIKNRYAFVDGHRQEPGNICNLIEVINYLEKLYQSYNIRKPTD